MKTENHAQKLVIFTENDESFIANEGQYFSWREIESILHPKPSYKMEAFHYDRPTESFIGISRQMKMKLIVEI